MPLKAQKPKPQNKKGLTPATPSKRPNIPPMEVLDKLPEDVRIAVIEAASFVGPLPPPSMFNAYGHVVQDAPNRILTMAEKEQEYRIESDQRAMQYAREDNRRGQWLGSAVALSYITAAVVVSVYGQPWVGGMLGGIGILSAITDLVLNRQERGAGRVSDTGAGRVSDTVAPPPPPPKSKDG